MSVKNSTGGILLVAGTCVGAGTLALPISTAALGLNYSLIAFFICWSFMTLSALLMLEANLRIAPGANLISMADLSLGLPGKIIAWIVYLMLLYSLTAAYLNGASGWIISQVEAIAGSAPSPNQSAMILVSIVAVIVYAGHAFADWTNRILMLGLVGAFASLLWTTAQHFSIEQLNSHPAYFDVNMYPLLITAFGYHIVIPTLTAYIDCSKRLKSIILVGATIPLIIYFLWEVWMFGLFPTSTFEHIAQAKNTTAALTDALQSLSHRPIVASTISSFTIFVITTSFIGVTLSLFDFIADGLNIAPNTRERRLEITLLTFIPPLLFVMFYPAGFLFALSFAGIFVAILLGIYPALMVWHSRYIKPRACSYTVWGGKPLLVAVILFFASIVWIAIRLLF